MKSAPGFNELTLSVLLLRNFATNPFNAFLYMHVCIHSMYFFTCMCVFHYNPTTVMDKYLRMGLETSKTVASNVTALAKSEYSLMDTDGDGTVTNAEIIAHMRAR